MLTPNTNRNGDLPADIILEILLRLPVKSLLRFKCVCKHWYSLIGSRDFVNRHFGHESNQERLLIQYCNPNKYLNTFAFVVDETCSAYEEHDLLQMPDSVYGLLGPVNGVFCVAGLSEEVALLNPAMRQFKPLSLPCPDVQPDLWPFKNVVGFGLDPLSGDYKLVQIQYFYNDEMDGGHDSALVSVYNSGSDSWRHFEDVALVNSSHCVYGSLCNTYLDGLCYWLMEFDNGNVAAILAFDMTTEKFLEIKVPDCIKWKTGRLALCGDSLTLLSYDMNMNDKFFDIWVMGEEGCWTRSSTVGPFQDIQWPLCFWKNNELLFETGSSQLILHNVFTQKLRTVDLERNENGFSRHWGFSYKESLVSIKREGDNCILWDTSSDFVKYFFNLSSSNK